MAEALPDGQATLGCACLILAEIGDMERQRIIQRHAALLDKTYQRVGCEDDFGEGCEIEPVRAVQRDALRLALRKARREN